MGTRVHRFFVKSDIKLKKDFWLHDQALLWQWNKVLRFREGQEVILFDGLQTDRMYNIEKLTKTEAHLVMVTELARQLPSKNVYLFWSLLKNDHNDLILEKATEVGVSNFVPLLTSRTIRRDFNHERAMRIVTEAAEQCGRSNVPHVRDPIHIEKVLEEYKDELPIFVCQQGSGVETLDFPEKVGVLVGPEGGWSEAEIELFQGYDLPDVSLGQFTLRAETAAIVAVSHVSMN